MTNSSHQKSIVTIKQPNTNLLKHITNIPIFLNLLQPRLSILLRLPRECIPINLHTHLACTLRQLARATTDEQLRALFAKQLSQLLTLIPHAIRHTLRFLSLRCDFGEAAAHADDAFGFPLGELVGVDEVFFVVAAAKVQDCGSDSCVAGFF